MTVGVRVADYIATITTWFVTLKYQSNLFLFFGLLLQLCFCEEAVYHLVHRTGPQEFWDLFPAMPLTHWVTLVESLIVSRPHCLQL